MTTPPPARPAHPTESTEPPDLPIRRLSPYDLGACLDLAEDRGWSREEHKWRLLLTAGQGYGIDAPDRPHGLIGVFVLTPYPETAPGTGAYTCVGMVVVAQRYARRGLGRRMMEHAVAESGGAAPFLSATEGGRPLYAQLGFQPVGSTTTLTGTFVPEDADAAAPDRTPAVSVRTATAADLPAVLELDAEVFGADRTELLARLPAFADRFVIAETGDAAGIRARGVPGESGRPGIAGFAAGWPNGGTTVAGPVVAQDLRTAQALVTDLGRHAPGPLRFDVDARHAELDRWLRARGLEGSFRCTLMVRTAPDIPGDIGRRFAPYSIALG